MNSNLGSSTSQLDPESPEKVMRTDLKEPALAREPWCEELCAIDY